MCNSAMFEVSYSEMICKMLLSKWNDYLNPNVDSPPFAAAVPLQHYQVDPTHQPLGLTAMIF